MATTADRDESSEQVPDLRVQDIEGSDEEVEDEEEEAPGISNEPKPAERPQQLEIQEPNQPTDEHRGDNVLKVSFICASVFQLIFCISAVALQIVAICSKVETGTTVLGFLATLFTIISAVCSVREITKDRFKLWLCIVMAHGISFVLCVSAIGIAASKLEFSEKKREQTIIYLGVIYNFLLLALGTLIHLLLYGYVLNKHRINCGLPSRTPSPPDTSPEVVSDSL